MLSSGLTFLASCLDIYNTVFMKDVKAITRAAVKYRQFIWSTLQRKKITLIAKATRNPSRISENHPHVYFQLLASLLSNYKTKEWIVRIVMLLSFEIYKSHQ